jgi:RNA polymerase sigma factor (sigma-70 family)
MQAGLTDAHTERTRQFHAIYRREFEFVWASARRFGVAPGAVDDAVQDVFLTAYRRLDHLRYEVSPRAWLYAVTRRVASHYRRGAARRARRMDALRATPAQEETPQQRLDAARQLERLLERLGSANRTVFEMVELLGMSGPEVAAELGQPLNTVYSRLRLARARLQELVSGPELAACVAAQRERDAPPPEAAQRSWAVVAPLLGKPAASVGVLGWLSTRAAVATTMIAGGVVAVALTREATSGTRAPAPVEDVAPAAAPRASAAPVAAPGADDLPREVALVDGARARLAADAPAEALALLAEHAREFPGGALADAREATRAEALCRRGEVAAAEAVARELLADHPGSSIARRLEKFRCRVDGTPGVAGK